MFSKKYHDFPESDISRPVGVRRVGAVPAGELIDISIYLKPRSAPRTSGTNSTNLRAALHAKRAGEHEGDILLIKEFAAEHGLAVTAVESGQRLVKLAGPASKVEVAFDTKLSLYDDGKKRFRGREGVLKLPDDVLAMVQSVLGLDTRPLGLGYRPRGGAPAPSAYLPNQVGALYNFPTGVDGTGLCIALLEFAGGYSAADISQAFLEMNLTPPQVLTAVGKDLRSNAFVNGGFGNNEVALDIQVAGGVAPGAKIAVYFASPSAQGYVAAMSAAVHDVVNAPSVVSMSWGHAEDVGITEQYRNSMDTVLQDAIHFNVSVFIAAGDGLSTDFSPDFIADNKVHVDYPASSPYAIGCGGTDITTSGTMITSEVVWNDIYYGTGGGISTVYGVPDFQLNANLPANLTTGKSGRGVPDVAGYASNDGYKIVLEGETTTAGGTSAVAPLWAGLTALINEATNQHIGFFLPFIYQHPGALRDITKGNNFNYNLGATFGYQAGSGWDPCTGLGVPDGTVLLKASLCLPLFNSVTSLKNQIANLEEELASGEVKTSPKDLIKDQKLIARLKIQLGIEMQALKTCLAANM